MDRAFVILVLGLCLSKEVLTLEVGSESVDLNSAVAEINARILTVSKELDAEEKGENDQLAAAKKEVSALVSDLASIDLAISDASAAKDAAARQVAKKKAEKLHCDAEHEKRKKIRREEFASLTTLRGLIAQVQNTNSSTVLELVGNITEADLVQTRPATSDMEMIQIAQRSEHPSAGLVHVLRSIGQKALNAVAERHKKEAIQLDAPLTSDIQVSASRQHSQLDELSLRLNNIEDQLNREDITQSVVECNNLDQVITKSIDPLKARETKLRATIFNKTEAMAVLAAKESIQEAVSIRNAKAQSQRAIEYQLLKQITSTLNSLQMPTPLSSSSVQTKVIASVGNKRRSAMESVSYILHNMIVAIDAKTKDLTSIADEAIAKLKFATNNLASKKKEIQELQASTSEKQKVYIAKKATHDRALSAETAELNKMAAMTRKIEQLQVMANDLLWSTSSISRQQLLEVTDPMQTELSSLQHKRAELKTVVKTAGKGMQAALDQIDAQEQKLASAKQKVKEIEDTVAIFDLEKRKLAEQLSEQLQYASSQRKIISDLKSMVARFLSA